MAEGRAIFFDEARGFGFIRPDEGGADVFVHTRHMTNSNTLRADQRVSFEIVHDEQRGKPRADNVRVL
jgi:CspA family cold shock protein